MSGMRKGTMKKPLIVLTGPTAVGKTSLSVRLAKAIGGEIISADSMQVYRHMNIGSAKIMPEEMEGVPHHLVDILDPREDFHIVRFQEMALKAMEGIYDRNHIPMLVGGTGFYIQAVTRGIDFTPAEQLDDRRAELEQLAREKGSAYLHGLLREQDPEAAAAIHPNNVKRIIRALEFYEQNQKPISEHNREERRKESPYALTYFVLDMPRDLLYRRIDERVDRMMEQGLLEEVQSLLAMGVRRPMTSMQAIGYKEIADYLEGKYSLEEAVRVLKRDTRHFAKRQLTWFRREPDVIWVEKDAFDYDEERILDHMIKIIDRRSRNIETDRSVQPDGDQPFGM